MITFEEIKRKCELLRDEVHNRSISASRLGTILLEMIREVQDADKEVVRFFQEYIKQYDEVYYYEEDWEKMSERQQNVLIRSFNRLVILEGAAPAVDPFPAPTPPTEGPSASYSEETGIITADGSYDESTGIVTLSGTYDEETGIVTLETATQERKSATYDEVMGIVNVEGSYNEETGIVSFDGSYDNGIITL